MIAGTSEFKLKLEVNPKCGEDPTLCPCPDDSHCPKVITSGKINNVESFLVYLSGCCSI